MAAKPQQTLADYVTMALSPVLIMALIGSLVFFLQEVLYGGDQYGGRLNWTFFWFIFGIVLVSRISMHPAIGDRWIIYGAVLSLVCYVALAKFFSLERLAGGDAGVPLKPFDWVVNLFLIALIWWCAHRLTWDCTHIDDRVDASGKGVLEAAGLDEGAGPPPAPPQPSPAEQEEGWLARYRRYREEQRKKPHTPGVWVVYFSLAALPLYGLGQALIPAEDVEARRYTFWLMSIYVASGLGLLVTTSFLGLRRYLRQRKLQMPAAMTATWIGLGGALIAVLLLLGVLLPRPHAEYPLLNLGRYDREERDASEYAQMSDSAGKGEGRPSSEQPKEKQKASDGAGTKLDKEGAVRGNEKSPNQDPAGAKTQNKDGSSGGKKDGSGQGRDQESQDSAKSKSQAKQKNKAQDAPKGGDGPPPDARKKEDRSGGKAASPPRSRPRPSGPRPPAELPGWLGRLATVLKWVVFAVLALVVVFFLATRGLSFLANFTDWARRLLEAWRAWWAGLFGGTRERAGQAAEAFDAAEDKPWDRPFAAFHNPFASGLAERLSPNQVVRYSFEALQAWARERGLGRRPDETPLEFADRLGEEVPGLAAEVKRLAGLFARVSYARATLRANSLDELRQFWQRLDAVVEQPLSA
jgi:Domain of unknown function (DUF4129)